jgi:tetratricopeptide (TPR) repeat protein
MQLPQHNHNGFQMNRKVFIAEQLTVRLHDLIRDGHGDDSKADNVREELIDVLSTVSTDDRRMLNDLSGDLLMLSSEEALVTRADITGIELKAAWEARDWHQLRELLVYEIPQVPPDYRAYLRGRAWGELGYHRAAAEFLFFAWKARPEKDNYGYLAVQALLDSDAFEEAWTRAAEIATAERASATLLYKVADVLYVGANRCEPGFQPRLYERVIEVVDKASQFQQPSVVSIRIAGLVKKAFAFANLARLDKADATLTQALELDRNNDVVLSARGLVRVEANRSSDALLDFVRAVEERTLFAWPYAYLAEHAIRDHEFERALDLIEECLPRTRDERLRANLFEWRAIVMHSLGRTGEAMQSANEAESLEPFNERITRNLELIRNAQSFEKLQLAVDFTPGEMRLSA